MRSKWRNVGTIYTFKQSGVAKAWSQSLFTRIGANKECSSSATRIENDIIA